MKKVDIISNIVARKGEALATPSMDISKVNLSGYLLKSIWDKVFEIRTDSQGIEYIFGKLPMVTQYGITMYSGDGVDVPSLASGLPFDGRTIWYNPETQQIEVIGGTGGGSGGGLDITALQNYLTQNSYLNVTEGDNRYLKLSGGTLSSNSRSPLTLKSGSSENHSLLLFNRGSDYWGSIGFNAANSLIFKNTNGVNYIIWNGSNFTPSDYLQLSGGTLTNTLTIDNSNVGLILHRSGQSTPYIRFGQDANNEWGELGVYNDGRLVFWPLVSSQGGYNQWNTVWHSGNDGSGSGLDADLLDGQQGSWYQHNVLGFARYNYTSNTASEHDANAVTDGMLYNYGSADYWKNAPSGLSYGQILSLSSANNTALMGQLAWDINHNSTSDTTRTLWWRGIQGKDRMSYAKWHQIAFTDSNVASATKLQTARTIWGQSFDGTGNVTGQLNITTGSNVTLTYGTGLLTLGTMASAHIAIDTNDIQAKADGTTASTLYLNDYGGNVSMCGNGGNVGIGTTNPSTKLDVKGHTTITYTPSSSIRYTGLEIINEPTGGEASIGFTSSSTNKAVVGVWDSRLNLWTQSKQVCLSIPIATGNVLIGGASDDAYKLNVGGSLQIKAGDYINNRATLILNSNSGAAGDIIFKCNSTTKGNYGWWAISSRNDSTGSLSIFRGSENGANSSELRVLNLDSSGNMLVSGGITMYSMRKLKNVVNERGLSLSELSTIKPTRYTWKDGRDNKLHIGGIADDIEQVLPEVVYKTSDGVLTMDYGNAAFAVAASLIKPVIDHEKRIAMLEEENKQLRQEVERLKSA